MDQLQIKFCKIVKGVRNQIPTVTVLGELGRKPLSVVAKERSIKCCLGVMKNLNSTMSI